MTPLYYQYGHFFSGITSTCVLCGITLSEVDNQTLAERRYCSKASPPTALLDLGLSGEFIWWRMIQLSKLGFLIEYVGGADQIICSVQNPLRGQAIDYINDPDFGILPIYAPVISHGISTYSLDVGYRELIGLEFDLEWSKSVTARTITSWQQVQAIEKRESYSRSGIDP